MEELKHIENIKRFGLAVSPLETQYQAQYSSTGSILDSVRIELLHVLLLLTWYNRFHEKHVFTSQQITDMFSLISKNTVYNIDSCQLAAHYAASRNKQRSCGKTRFFGSNTKRLSCLMHEIKKKFY